MKLSPHFTLDEMTRSQTASRYDIDNRPGESELISLVYTCQILEQVRRVCGGNVVFVSSGFRCPELNMRIGGSRQSAHIEGRAADFTIPGFGDIETVAGAIRSAGIPYKKLILEFGRWLHIEAHPLNEGGQGQTLVASRVHGQTVYEVAA